MYQDVQQGAWGEVFGENLRLGLGFKLRYNGYAGQMYQGMEVRV
jgi:hypothetical protein